ncbi:hypothetical protein Y032_0028g1805 [Ancylostoma ceylanicum]|uniref:GPI ethanolamine phosphate transferase 1 n=1 Tax=Ancylostoma ceylanicum TaxID=53326 RepID=A0A016UV43_9BILA|nr:hypothetical protein Y032_0028g1805 [Ancylostoma ceylanicum]
MLTPLSLLLLLGVSVAKDPIGQNVIVLLIDGYGASLLNESKPESKFGKFPKLSCTQLSDPEVFLITQYYHVIFSRTNSTTELDLRLFFPME